MRKLSALVDAVASELSHAIGAPATAALQQRTRALPLDVSRLLGFEVPLDGEHGPDLAVRLHSESGLALAVDRDPRLAQRLGGGPELEQLLTLLRDGDGSQAREAWLEYDVASGDGEVPCLFAGPASPTAVLALARLVGGTALTSEALGTIEALAAGLGPGERVAQVAFMHSRRPPTAVVTLRGRRLPQAAGVLPEDVQRWPAPTTMLAVQLDGTTSSRVGLELSTPTAAHGERLLETLVQAGLAEAGLAQRILAWRGHRAGAKESLLASDLAVLDDLTRGRLRLAVVRRLAHVKVTVEPALPPTAKAYLSVSLWPLL